MNFEKIRFFIRRRGIGLSALSASTGYSKVHISAVLHERRKHSPQCIKLLKIALKEIAPAEHQEELEGLMKGDEI